MDNKFYFFRTVMDGSMSRLRALPFQTDNAGRMILVNLNVQGNSEMRRDYPVGTVFGSADLFERENNNTPFYASGDLFPVSVEHRDILNPSHVPSDEMKAAYNAYMSQYGDKLNEPGAPSTGVFSETATPRRPLSLLEKLKRTPKFQPPTIEKDGFYVDEEKIWWPMMCALVTGAKNIFFTGPQGSGKTEIVRLVAERMGLPLHIYDMGSMYDPIADLHGVHRMTEKGSVFDYAQFTQDIQSKGIVMLDELSRATAAANNTLLPVLDWRRRLRVEAAGSSDAREFKVHPKCRIIASANLGPEFVGANALDIALDDRFYLKLEMEYMPADQEINLLINKYKIARADAVNIVNTAQSIRKNAAAGDLQRTLSVRKTMAAAEFVSFGYDARSAMKLIFLPDFEGTLAEGERAVVWASILKN